MNYRLRLLAAAISTLLLGGCVHDSWSYRAVPNVSISIPNQLGSEGPVVLKAEPSAPIKSEAAQQWSQEHQLSVASRQTVLTASWQHDLGSYNTSVGRTLVIMLDGLPKPGKYWLTPDNAVLVSFSAYAAPSRERVGLEGSINILSVKGDEIVADLTVRDARDIDTSEFFDQPWDPLHRQMPFRLVGKHTFAVTGPNDPVFEKTGVKWQ